MAQKSIKKRPAQSVEERAEEEAEKKHLHGQTRKRYIGGVFNRVRQERYRPKPPKETAKEREAAHSRLWKKYHTQDVPTLRSQLRHKYSELTQPSKQKVSQWLHRHDMTMSELRREELEKLLDYVEGLPRRSGKADDTAYLEKQKREAGRMRLKGASSKGFLRR